MLGIWISSGVLLALIGSLIVIFIYDAREKNRAFREAYEKMQAFDEYWEAQIKGERTQENER